MGCGCWGFDWWFRHSGTVIQAEGAPTDAQEFLDS